MSSNEWCRALGIERPRVDAVASHPEANSYTLLIVALLEHGAPMTLAEVAARLVDAGVGELATVTRSLQRCRPARAPVYRDGDRYALDPRDDELDLWAFRLGLRPPKVSPQPRSPREPEPVPDADVPLTNAELDEAFRDASLYSWTQQRLALAVLDANGGPLSPDEVVSAIASRTRHQFVKSTSASFGQVGSAVAVLDDGRWAIADGSAAALTSARKAVRDRVAMVRRRAAARPTPEELAEGRRRWDEQKAALRAERDAWKRALIATYPQQSPRVAALLDVSTRAVETFVGPELDALVQRLGGYDSLGAVDVRGTLRGLGFDPETRHLAELAPSQKTLTLPSGEVLKITLDLIARGTCGLARPFGDPAKTRERLAAGDFAWLRRRLAADLTSLYAVYQYGRLHGSVRVRTGWVDAMIAAPWKHRDERSFYEMQRTALERGARIEVVLDRAPSLDAPWERGETMRVMAGAQPWEAYVVDPYGRSIDDRDVQAARIVDAPTASG
ncbi:MAG: hypothetical protein R3A52_27980 [Polyangiales bacterium]